MEKTVCELFAGVGGFRVGLGEEWKTVFANQWEPGRKRQDAFECYCAHFGRKPEYVNEDISEIDKSEIPDHTLLVGGFPCLEGSTLVLTKDGYRAIKDVEEGDLVLSHDGAFHRVTTTSDRGEKEAYRLEADGLFGLTLTGNHRLYVRRHGGEPCWMSVDEMTGDTGTELGVPVNRESEIPLWTGALDISKPRLWYVVGRWLADGTTCKQHENKQSYRAVAIRCRPQEVRKLKAAFDVFLPYTFSAGTFVFASAEFSRFMKAFRKGFPGFVFDLPVPLLSSLLMGYADASGQPADKSICLETKSPELALGLAQIFQKVRREPAHLSASDGKYVVRFPPRRKASEDGILWFPIKSVKKLGKPAHVYDIGVEGTHSFVAENCISHNCQDYSVAHTGAQGIEGKKGVLWWQIRDTLEAKRPPFVLLENVDRLLKSPAGQRGRDFGIILASFRDLGYRVEWRVVNAADYGFVQRRRRTFIFAYRPDTPYAGRMKGADPHGIVTHYGFFATTFPMKEDGAFGETELPHEDLAGISAGFAFPFETAGFMKDGRIWTVKAAPAYDGEHAVLRGIMDRGVEEGFLTDKELEKMKYLKGAKRFERTAKNGHKYMYSEGPVAFPDPVDKPARTMLTSEATVNRSTHVVEDLDNGKLRYITPEEAEAIQGFPKGWTDTGMSKRFRYFCMGNALVTGLVGMMGRTLERIC